MKRSEITELLRAASRVDRWINPNEPEVIEEWSAIMARDDWLTFPLALDALRQHYHDGNRTVMPSDVISRASSIAGERLMTIPVPMAVYELAEQAAGVAGGADAFQAVVAAARTAIIAGQPPVPAAEDACVGLARAGSAAALESGRP